jgi:hypothetical protein
MAALILLELDEHGELLGSQFGQTAGHCLASEAHLVKLKVTCNLQVKLLPLRAAGSLEITN